MEERARCILIDIAGVPVMDTNVANTLLNTIAAVRLLGSTAIVTGVSAQVAKTMVRLGVAVPDIQTVNSLSEGIELALRVVGRRIVRD